MHVCHLEGRFVLFTSALAESMNVESNCTFQLQVVGRLHQKVCEGSTEEMDDDQGALSSGAVMTLDAGTWDECVWPLVCSEAYFTYNSYQNGGSACLATEADGNMTATFPLYGMWAFMDECPYVTNSSKSTNTTFSPHRLQDMCCYTVSNSAI